MVLAQAHLTAQDVLHAYLDDSGMLFLGSAFITVAVIAFAFCLVRRRFDPLLGFLAMFAYLYGQRLRMNSEILALTIPHNEFFLRLRVSINYLVPIPAAAFFEAAGFIGRRGKAIVILLSLIFLSLVGATFLLGPHHLYDTINNIVVILAILALAIRSQLDLKRDSDFKVLRIGLLCLVVTTIFDNVRDFWAPSRIEPYGFVVFLACLGYVAARRMIRRDQELGEIHAELELARRIQLSILPAAFPTSAHFHVAARYVPMTSVAGDFYDFLSVSDTQAGILIADVSGHGVPAALIASMVKMAATSQRASAADPAALLTGMNAALAGNTQSQFVTAAYVHLDAIRAELRYSAAGHPAMLLLRDGQVFEIVENGFMLAVTSVAAFSNATQPLIPGDRLVLHTDGLLEARNTARELYGEDRLHAIVRETASLTPDLAAEQILAAVEQWQSTQEDDLTLLICDYTGA
jgi:phosphoserine phosphatase RsbU/P